VRRVVETGIQPRINTGIAHRHAGVGQIGAGLVRAPLDPFVAAHRHLRAIRHATGQSAGWAVPGGTVP